MEKYDPEEYKYFAYGTEYAITRLKDKIEQEYDKVKYITSTEDYLPDKDKVYLIPCDTLFLPAFKFCNFEENYKIPSHLIISDNIINSIAIYNGGEL